jgi:hypothetical protein
MNLSLRCLCLLVAFNLSGCGHSFVRSAGDLGGQPGEFAGLLYKNRWQKTKVLPVAKEVRIEARVATDEGDQVIDGTLVGGSATQAVLLVELGAADPTPIPTAALRRIKVHDTRYRDKGMVAAMIAGGLYVGLIGSVPGAIIAGFGGNPGLGLSVIGGSVALGAAAGYVVGRIGTKGYYIVDFTQDAWTWELPEP